MQLTKIYGYKFTRCFGHQDEGTWYSVLSDLGKNDLRYGLARLAKGFHENEIKQNACWPPNAKEFRLMCLQKSIEDEKDIKSLRTKYFELKDQFLTCRVHKAHWLKLYGIAKDNPKNLKDAQLFIEQAKANELKAEHFQNELKIFQDQHSDVFEQINI